MRVKLAVACFLITLTGCSHRQPAAVASRPTPVQVRNVALVNHLEEITVSGSVNSPDAAADIPFLVSGRVLRVAVHEGDAVRKGQLLASLDPTDHKIAVRGAAAQVAAAKVSLDRAEDEYKRMKMLFESKSLPQNDFRKFQAAFDAAKEQFNQAIAGEDSARKHLSDTTLLAPVSGYISRRAVEPGNVAAAGVPAFQIVTLDPVEVLVGVPETDIRLVRLGQHAQVQIPALPGQEFSGNVRVINVSADPATRTYSTRIQVPNADHKLRVGMIAEVQIQGDRQVKAITVPGSAIVHDPQGASQVFVYYPEQKRAYSKRVEVGRVVGQEVEIQSGLHPDDLVVIGGQHSLRDGLAAEAIETQAPSLAVAGAEVK